MIVINKEYVIDEGKKLHPNAKKIRYTIDSNGCYICVSHALNSRSYPVKRFNGKSTAMSRYIWFINTGKHLESSEHVLHKCDNTKCINYKHLFTGSNYDNVKDKMNKNRQARHSKLTNDDIINIKTNVKNTSAELANTYKVSADTIMKIWNEKTYRYIVVDNYEYYKIQRKDRLSKASIKNLKTYLDGGNHL